MHEQEEIYRKIVKEAVHETLLGVGFDLREPSQMQADMHYLRKLRHGSEDMTRVLQRSAITLGFSTALFLLWEAFKSILQK
ncbi:MAG: hypothetical protein FJX23_10415 [Alphaproteobacteria bacterium]|nr:hypothetical protein [Alphaproteobacteria bacterium]